LKLEAQALVARVLALKNDLAKRSDNGLETTASEAALVKLKLKPNLKSGIYVVMYRILSVDTHITQDFFTFSLSSN
jgi:copper resistance protein C